MARRWIVLFLCLGVAARLLRSLLQFPLWGDEAFIALNVIDKDYLGLTQGLRFNQIAPILFLWMERASFLLLGSSELTMRLPALLAGVGALFLFARFARLSLRPRTAAFAVALFAVSYYPIRHACEVKPYAFDLLASVLLLTLAAVHLRTPHRKSALIALTAFVPVALLSSYPAVFVAGAVSIALLPIVWKQRDPSTWAWFLSYNLVMVLTFVGHYYFVGQRQYVDMGSEQNVDWHTWFAPREPLALLKFLLLSHTGNLFAYPIGGPNGGSTLTFCLCLMGGWRLWKSKRRSLLLLLTMPFVLTFFAALLQRYPYGGSARVAQHLAAPICTLMALGGTHLLAVCSRSSRQRERTVAGAMVVLLLLVVGGMVRDVLQPFKTKSDWQCRDFCQRIASGSDDQVLLAIQAPPRLYPTFEWYLRRHAGNVVWLQDDNSYSLRVAPKHVHELRFYRRKDRSPSASASRMIQQQGYGVHQRQKHALDMGPFPEAVHECEVLRYRRLAR